MGWERKDLSRYIIGTGSFASPIGASFWLRKSARFVSKKLIIIRSKCSIDARPPASDGGNVGGAQQARD
jgi:hypothetical protein